MELWIGALNLGLLYAFMAMGVFVTFRIHDFPDITVDSSFVTGAAVTAVLIVAGVHPSVAMGASFAAGACAGSITAFIHTRFSINGLLSGIIVMTGLYSINLHIMGKSNIPLLNQPGLAAYAATINPGLPAEVWLCLILLPVVAGFWLLFSLFFNTDFGVTMRATGNNPVMAGSTGVNVDLVKTMGIALANGLVALSGSLVAQYQGFSDIGMGMGSIVFGLAAVIIGESLLRTRSIHGRIASVIVGSLVFRLMVAFALYVGLNPIDLKLVTALFVLAVLILPKITERSGPGGIIGEQLHRLVPSRKIGIGVVVVCVVAGLGLSAFRPLWSKLGIGPGKARIGVVQLTDTAILNITRDAFLSEMQQLGFVDGKTALFYIENAHGDMATVNTVIDRFLLEKVDLILAISSGCTQAAINKVKDRPVIFATVADPFSLGAGTSETEHLPNITGVYGAAPVETLMEMVTATLPGPIKIGCIWDPSQHNAVFNVERLRAIVARNKNVRFEGATVSGSSEVYQAASSLAAKGIDAFVLPPDNIVFSAFETIVKIASGKNIPIFISDVERLKDGALGACGYDYASSGIQAARMADRIIKGAKPSVVPFERYSKVTIGVDQKTAGRLGITVPPEVLARCTVIHNGSGVVKGQEPRVEKRRKRLALFLFSDSPILQLAADGMMDELKKSQTLKEINVDMKNAHNDYAAANAIIQDVVRQKYDFLVTFSTLALQAAANGNKTIPHVFGAVTDPYGTGVAKSAGEHAPNITGVATSQPVQSTIKTMRILFPRAKRIGIVWNPAEANSEACTKKTRIAARENGFELVERTVNATDEVKDAVSALLLKNIDLFFTSGDNTAILAMPTVVSVLKERKIPYFTNDPSDVDRGVFFSVGADYYQVGVETARMTERIIAGEDPRKIPIKEYAPERMTINADLARLYEVHIPEALRSKIKEKIKTN